MLTSNELVNMFAVDYWLFWLKKKGYLIFVCGLYKWMYVFVCVYILVLTY